ncbi:MAG: hypothetical protein F6K42_21760 [Leptolyngbya sp. SIO1D8]|nr:hypothetical protein [Leptolyngbya sp. SIO1D8]
MNTTQTQPSDVIDQMVALRKQLAQIEAQIEALKPAFFRNRTSQRRLNRTASFNLLSVRPR